MNRAPVLLHIGYHKTATSTLQQQLFAVPDAPFCVPDNEPKYIFSNKVVLPQPMTFDAAATRAEYEDFVRKTQDLGKVPVFSHERFSGYPASGGFDSTLIADRLHQMFPEAYVFVVFREQLSSILSMYSQYITDGGHKSLKRYLTQVEPSLRRVPSFSPEFYRYHRLFRYYQNLFGKERVLGLTFEQLLEDPKPFLNQLCSFAGVTDQERRISRANAKRSESFQILQRIVNRTLCNNQLSGGALLPIPNATRKFGKLSGPVSCLVPRALDQALKRRLVNTIKERFDGAFAESNAILQELSGLDLKHHGYQLPET